MKKRSLIYLSCISLLASFMAVMPLPAENLPAENAALVEQKMAEKIARLEAETQEYETALAQDGSAAANAPKPVNNALFGWGQPPSYTTTHSGAWHFAIGVSGRGNHVFLEDGSGWMVAPSDAKKTLDWMEDDLIMVIPAPWYSFYSWVLVNYNTGAHVYADLKEKPEEVNAFTLQIAAISPESGTLILSDKTVWTVPGSYDCEVMQYWFVGQKVLIGINGADSWLDKWICKRAPNVLISVEQGVNGYVKCRCEY